MKCSYITHRDEITWNYNLMTYAKNLKQPWKWQKIITNKPKKKIKIELQKIFKQHKRRQEKKEKGQRRHRTNTKGIIRWQAKLCINNHTNINGLNFTVKRKWLSKWIIIQDLTTYCKKEMPCKDAN